MRCIRLTIAYDGTAYAGWQFQPGRVTVQETIQQAVEKVTGGHSSVLASGRTDAGVHALGQVAGFRTHCSLAPEVLLRALNANLPDDIAVLEVCEAPDDFHPIAHVVRKRYRYVIHDGPVRSVFQRNYVWHYAHGRLDADAMRRASLALVGTHDFSSFESSGAPRKDSVRTVFELTVQRTGQEWLVTSGLWPVTDRSEANPQSLIPNPCSFIVLEIEADGFLYNMVRAIVGTLVEVGRGRRPETWPAEVLLAADRREAGPTAPPQGLYLVSVSYGEERGERSGERERNADSPGCLP